MKKTEITLGQWMRRERTCRDMTQGDVANQCNSGTRPVAQARVYGAHVCLAEQGQYWQHSRLQVPVGFSPATKKMVEMFGFDSGSIYAQLQVIAQRRIELEGEIAKLEALCVSVPDVSNEPS